jgi:hypothetical protein
MENVSDILLSNKITKNVLKISNIYSYFNSGCPPGPEQSGKVEYKRERLLGIANK